MAEHERSIEEAQLREMLGLQLAEVEMLTSMFPDTQEFVVDDPASLADVQDFVDGQLPLDTLYCRIGFTVILNINIDQSQEHLEVVFRLPHEYPHVCPEVFVRAPFLSRHAHRSLSDDLHKYTDEDLERGDICAGQMIQWLQDNACQYANNSSLTLSSSQKSQQTANSPCSSAPGSPTTKQEEKFYRLWVYSHHIYSKIKRKDILEFADELKLSGFCMPGKPGMIVLEGCLADVDEFWQRIRRMQWKKLTMIEKEECTIADGETVDCYRKFTNFEEKHFDPRPGKGKGAHMDLGLLFEYLDQRGCGHIFHLYFGVDGKKSTE